MSNEDTNLNKIREKLIRDHEARLANLDNNRGLLQKVLDAMPTDSVKGVTVDVVGIDIAATGGRPILVAAIRAFRINGFESATKPIAGQSTYGAYFHSDKGLQIWFYFSSTQCRRVKVGSRTVTEDIYETVCDEHEQATA